MASLPAAITRVGVIGSGQMGLGIAYVSALHAKAKVSLYDASPAQLDKGVNLFESLLKKDVTKNKISQQEADEARSRLVLLKSDSHGVEAFASASAAEQPQMIIEAVTENLAVKQDIFSKLAKVMPLETILATNTSSISVTKIAASAKRADDAEGKSPARVCNKSRAVSTASE